MLTAVGDRASREHLKKTHKHKNKNQTSLKGAIVGHDKNKENNIKIKNMFSSKSLLSLGWLTWFQLPEMTLIPTICKLI